MIDKLIDIHLNGDIGLKKISKKDYDILYSDIVTDMDYNYAFLKNNNVNIEDVLEQIKKDFKELNRKPILYVLSNIMNDNIKSNKLKINQTDTWMVLDNLKEFKTDLDIKYSQILKKDLDEFINTFMINFSSDEEGEPYKGLEDDYRKSFYDNYEEHNGFKSFYYVGKINNKIVCTCMGIYKDNAVILYAGSVNKEYRRKGIFKEFLNYIIKDLKEKNIDNICLETAKGYYPEKLYEKVGFKEVLQGSFYDIL